MAKKRKKRRTAAQRAAFKKMQAGLRAWRRSEGIGGSRKRKKGKRRAGKRKGAKRKGRTAKQRAATQRMINSRWDKLGIAPWGKAFSKSRGFAAKPVRAAVDVISPAAGALNAKIRSAIAAAHKAAQKEGRVLLPAEVKAITTQIRGQVSGAVAAATGGAVAALNQQRAVPLPSEMKRTGKQYKRVKQFSFPGIMLRQVPAPAGMKGTRSTRGGAVGSPSRAKSGAKRRKAKARGNPYLNAYMNPIWNPQYFPRRGARKGRLRWYILDIFHKENQLVPSVTMTDLTTKGEAERAAERLLCEHKAANVELSGPYRSQPHAETARK